MDTTAAAAPIEGRCDHCKQSRAVFLYQPDHGAHLEPYGGTCPWCTRERQPLLCVRCWGAEREREEGDPQLNAEAEVWAKICATNARIFARQEADRAALEGIAAATEAAEAAGGES